MILNNRSESLPGKLTVGIKIFWNPIVSCHSYCSSVASLLAATLYQGHHDRNHKLWWNIGSTHTPQAGSAGMLLHINGKFWMGKSLLS